MDQVAHRPVPDAFRVSLTRGPERPDGARTSLLPDRERYGSMDELRREYPDVASALTDGRLFGPTWSELGTKYEAEFATYGEFRRAFPEAAARIRRFVLERVDDDVPGVRLVVYATDTTGR